jgi:two-component system phosphate regulon sensor histidine kinase PhoR
VSPSIRWRIAIPYVLLTLVAMLGLGVHVSGLVREVYLDSLEANLTAEARLIGDAVIVLPEWYDAESDLDPRAKEYAELLNARVTFIGTDGVVLGESHEDRSQMDNHLFRPEVQGALNEGLGSSLRYSKTMGYEMMYVALPVMTGGQVTGIVRVALPSREIESDLAELRWTILTGALFTLGGVALLAALVAERTARPVRQLTEAVQRVAEGDLDVHLLPTTRDEVGTLTRAFNQMADRLRGTITTLSEEQGRLSGILDNMADGVLITDGDGRVRLINPAAAKFLGIDADTALGRSLAEVTRDHRIIDLWQECRTQREERIEPVEIGRQGPFFQVVVTPLAEVGPGSCLIILQDLTRIRRLETVRRDFISNISHELRTPLASLKALVDTLRDGALEDPPAAQRFLDRMDIEVDALTQMVQELLELSRIESGQVPFCMTPVPVADVVSPSVDRLRPQSERAGLELSVTLPPDLPRILADPERAQQVITNLVHNAIKFTLPGGQVRVSGHHVQVSKQGRIQPSALDLDPGVLSPGEWVLVVVQDTGVGISVDDLPRIFERFYKADRARSEGGTGLGIAIAKHIVLAHDGHIWARSREGSGSTFYVALPALTLR